MMETKMKRRECVPVVVVVDGRVSLSVPKSFHISRPGFVFLHPEREGAPHQHLSGSNTTTTTSFSRMLRPQLFMTIDDGTNWLDWTHPCEKWNMFLCLFFMISLFIFCVMVFDVPLMWW